VITPGDPRGIGPEVALRALTLLGREQPTDSIRIVGPEGDLTVGQLSALAAAHQERSSDEEAGTVAARSIERAVGLALAGDAEAIITAPLHKPSLHAAGWPVPGQTEMLRDISAAPRVGMLMSAETTRLNAPLRVLLATTHLPLAQVHDAFTEDLLFEQVVLLDHALRRDWGIHGPRLAVCGINPHAGDGGLFGDEEQRIMKPALARARAEGVDVGEALPADTVFVRALNGEFDAVVTPYHDVGMAPFKTVSFGTGVNVTIGLPFIRTSPDHGTAFDIAGAGRADAGSMLEAIRLAQKLATNRFDTATVHV